MPDLLALTFDRLFGPDRRARATAAAKLTRATPGDARAAMAALDAWCADEPTRGTPLRGWIAGMLRAAVDLDGDVAGTFTRAVEALDTLDSFSDPEAWDVRDRLRALPTSAGVWRGVLALATGPLAGSPHLESVDRAVAAALLLEGSASSLTALEAMPPDVHRLPAVKTFAENTAARNLFSDAIKRLAAWRREREVAQVARRNGFAFEPPHEPELVIPSIGGEHQLRVRLSIDRVPIGVELARRGTAPKRIAPPESLAALPAFLRTQAAELGATWDLEGMWTTLGPRGQAAAARWLARE